MPYSITLTDKQKKELNPLLEKGEKILTGDKEEMFVIAGQLLLPDDTGRTLVHKIQLTMFTGINAEDFYHEFRAHVRNENFKQDNK